MQDEAALASKAGDGASAPAEERDLMQRSILIEGD
jgi:hypothetical protein